MGPALSERANTLDGLLDELPDFSTSDLFTVDQFWPTYVNALEQKGMQDAPMESQYEGATEFLPYLDGNQLGVDAMTLAPQQIQNDSAMDLSNQSPGSGIFLGGQENGGSSHFSGPVVQMPVIGGMPVTNEEPLYSEGSGSGGYSHGRRTSGRRGNVTIDYHGDSGDGMDSDDGKGKKSNGKSKRNAKQQAQNKQAQQRYRERRKQKFNDMEHAIDELNARLQQMQAVQSQNAVLVAKSKELEAALKMRDQELEKLRGQSPDGGDVNETGASFEERRQASDAQFHDLQGQAAENVRKLKDFIAQYNLRNADPSGKGVAAPIKDQMAKMIAFHGGCQNQLQTDGVKVLRLMSADMSQLSRLKCMRKCDCVTRGIQDLKLSDTQRAQLLSVRANHLENLKEIYTKRQQLNTQAMAFMLPGSATQGANFASLSVESKLEKMKQASYRRMAASAVSLDEILDSLKDNLKQEQKRVMELNFVTLHRLLSSIQAGLYITAIFPQSFDALELMNMLAQQADSAKSSNDGSNPHNSQTNSMEAHSGTDYAESLPAQLNGHYNDHN